jgi:hypothetical protein
MWDKTIDVEDNGGGEEDRFARQPADEMIRRIES